MAVDSGQPIGDLCDLLGISRYRPGVFDALTEILYDEQGSDAAREERLRARAHRRMGLAR